MTLNLQAIDRFFGQTVMEYIQTVPGELPNDAVGLWQIVPTGRQGFGLNGDDLGEFVRRCVLALLTHGAKPVVGGGGTQYDWILQPHYGETNEEIADTVMNEWLASGAGDCDPGGLWFALPSPRAGSIQ
ncbi:hypothetical protein GCM10027093_13450 [Paraburkholderia jirisanensis]